MWNIIDSLWSSLAIFLYALFLHGIALRFLREKRPTWFTQPNKQRLVHYALGSYYGLLGVYFIIRGLRGYDFGIYTDMIINILLITALFGGRGATLIATLIIASGKILITQNYSEQLIYAFFLIAFYFVVTELAALKIREFQKFILCNLSIVPFMLYYLPHKMMIPLDWRSGLQWIIIFAVSFLSSFILYQAARFVTAANKQIQELRYFSLHDPLTDLANYRYFETRFTQLVKKAKHKEQPLSLILFDIDWFKQINDSFGHQAGNHVLSTLGSMLREHAFPKNTFLARIGGEEFAILLPKTSEYEAIEFAEAFRIQVEQHVFHFGQKELTITISAGIASIDQEHIQNSDQMQSFADQALYAAKNAGRNRVMKKPLY
ncbi:GGDEF domain protein [Listeria floridensis FSL S10-1187]|uniref:GGDEF domain protein n=1 Tax=Listeria floridensis FSL S10-1187 TaxID=1265817 RepID=A0ABP3AZB3_9LIST|nr:GGDEF domain-containing protein [Listeria floridensis]EUJ32945.1 GGDEF domain protein [Listeria floridensis FSL S10-1187]